METLSRMVRCSYKKNDKHLYSTLSFKLSFPDFPRIFHFVILGFRSFQPEFAHANEINHDILRANTLF